MIRRNLTEFLALKQGNNSVLQYSQAFNTLAQYAGYHVDTDEKKQACFRQGSVVSSRIAWQWSSLTVSVSWSMGLSYRRTEKKRKAPAAIIAIN